MSAGHDSIFRIRLQYHRGVVAHAQGRIVFHEWSNQENAWTREEKIDPQRFGWLHHSPYEVAVRAAVQQFIERSYLKLGPAQETSKAVEYKLTIGSGWYNYSVEEI